MILNCESSTLSPSLVVRSPCGAGLSITLRSTQTEVVFLSNNSVPVGNSNATPSEITHCIIFSISCNTYLSVCQAPP